MEGEKGENRVNIDEKERKHGERQCTVTPRIRYTPETHAVGNFLQTCVLPLLVAASAMAGVQPNSGAGPGMD